MNGKEQQRCRLGGNSDQWYGSRLVTVEEGAGRGTRLLELHNACGLMVDLLPDNGLDLGRCFYRGHNLCYQTKNGATSPYRVLPVEDEFDHWFPGGMIFTCGLLNVGPQCRDRAGDGLFHPLHGRYHSLTCDRLSHGPDGDRLVVTGRIRETRQWGEALEVHRRVELDLERPCLRLTDRIVNCTAEPAELMTLYHVNFGAPFLSPETKIHWGPHCTTPRTAWAEAGSNRQELFEEPESGREEQVWFNEDFERPVVWVESPALGLVAQLEWSQDTLPRLSQWKTCRCGEYCLALEPSTCYTAGREAERARGTLVTLEPFGEREHSLTLTLKELALWKTDDC